MEERSCETIRRAEPPGRLFPGSSRDSLSALWIAQWLMGLTDIGVAAHACFYVLPRAWAAVQKNLDLTCHPKEGGPR